MLDIEDLTINVDKVDYFEMEEQYKVELSTPINFPRRLDR